MRKYDKCQNASDTGLIKQDQMIREQFSDLENLNNQEHEPLKVLVSLGQMIALYSNDPICDYYVIKVTLHTPTVLTVGTTIFVF